MIDKRKYPRLDKKWKVDYRTIPTTEFKAYAISSLTVNISGGGICFEAYEEIPIGTILVLELKSKVFSSPIISLAETSWTRKKKKGGKYEVGAEFWWMGWKDNNAQETLEKYISKEMKIQDKSA